MRRYLWLSTKLKVREQMMERAIRTAAACNLVGLLCLTGWSVASAQPAGPAKQTGRGACSLLTKAEVKKLAAVKDAFFDQIPAREQPLGTTGSSCSYSGIHIQLNPFSAERLEGLRRDKGPAWSAVPNVGDAAYLFDNTSATTHYAELYVRSGQNVVTIQMGVRPPEASIETVRPALVALAQALVAALR